MSDLPHFIDVQPVDAWIINTYQNCFTLNIFTRAGVEAQGYKTHEDQWRRVVAELNKFKLTANTTLGQINSLVSHTMIKLGIIHDSVRAKIGQAVSALSFANIHTLTECFAKSHTNGVVFTEVENNVFDCCWEYIDSDERTRIEDSISEILEDPEVKVKFAQFGDRDMTFSVYKYIVTQFSHLR